MSAENNAVINNMYDSFDEAYNDMEREEAWEEKIGRLYWMPVADNINDETHRDRFDDVVLKYLINSKI